MLIWLPSVAGRYKNLKDFLFRLKDLRGFPGFDWVCWSRSGCRTRKPPTHCWVSQVSPANPTPTSVRHVQTHRQPPAKLRTIEQFIEKRGWVLNKIMFHNCESLAGFHMTEMILTHLNSADREWQTSAQTEHVSEFWRRCHCHTWCEERWKTTCWTASACSRETRKWSCVIMTALRELLLELFHAHSLALMCFLLASKVETFIFTRLSRLEILQNLSFFHFFLIISLNSAWFSTCLHWLSHLSLLFPTCRSD